MVLVIQVQDCDKREYYWRLCNSIALFFVLGFVIVIVIVVCLVVFGLGFLVRFAIAVCCFIPYDMSIFRYGIAIIVQSSFQITQKCFWAGVFRMDLVAT